jgi:putative acetyltransferase
LVRLRRGRPADATAIARVMRAAVRGEAGRYPARDLEAWASLPPLYHRWAMTAGGETYLLALRGERLLGYAARRGAELTALFVRPSEVGKGLGTRLLARVEAGARPGRVGGLHLFSARAAVPFYAARGWRPVGAVRAPLPGGRFLAALRMVKGRVAVPPPANRRSPRAGRHARGR